MQLSTLNRSQLNSELRFDAEYYMPANLVAEKRVREKPHVSAGRFCDFVSGPFGSTVTTAKYVGQDGCRYIRGKDVHDFFIDDSDPVFIGRDFFSQLPQYHLRALDILVTVVGMNFGKTALIFSDDEPAIFSCKSSLLRTTALNPHVVAAFLSCSYGHRLLRRGQRGAAQPGINLSDLRCIPIPALGDELSASIESLVINARKTVFTATQMEKEAEGILISEIGLRDWQPKHSLTYLGRYSTVHNSRRMDAEYFEPKFNEMFSRIRPDVRLQSLSKLTMLSKGLEVGAAAYTDSGAPFWRVSNLTRHGPDENGLFHVAQELYDKLKADFEPKQGELLLSKDATPGVAFYLEFPLRGIISGGILRLQPKEGIPPQYLELALNSQFVQMQIERDAGGSVIKHWKPSQVRLTFVPRLESEKEENLAVLVQRSHAARREAKLYLDKAKRAVEIAIEENELTATAFLRKKSI